MSHIPLSVLYLFIVFFFSFQLGKLQCKSDEFNIQITSKDGHVHSLSSKVADFQKEVGVYNNCSLFHTVTSCHFQIVNLLGVPTAILDNVIFCHQEDSTWFVSNSSYSTAKGIASVRNFL